MAVTSQDLRAGLDRWASALLGASDELNELDGRLGDGDLGATLGKCAVNVQEALPAAPDDFAGLFKACATACAKASGSSFGTLLAVAFLTAAKSVPEAKTLKAPEIGKLLHGVVAALSARGGASLGDKTMLDSIDAIAIALDGAANVSDLRALAVDASRRALDDFRTQPNRIGRARMFAEKSVGMDDPGMVAILRMAQSL
jgi:dihydroxyacetone kinase-like protein